MKNYTSLQATPTRVRKHLACVVPQKRTKHKTARKKKYHIEGVANGNNAPSHSRRDSEHSNFCRHRLSHVVEAQSSDTEPQSPRARPPEPRTHRQDNPVRHPPC